MTEITESEYNNFLKTSDFVDQEYCSFSSFNGPHSFDREIHMGENKYLLSWGWGWNLEKPTEKYYGIEKLHMLGGLIGDGI